MTDSSKIQNLPLTGDGKFGSEFENLLKTKNDYEREIEYFLPDVQVAWKKGNFTKRKSQTPSPMYSAPKPRYDKPSTSSWGNFRISKV